MYLLFDIGGTNLRLANSPDGKTVTQIHYEATPKNPSEAIRSIIAYSHKNGKKLSGVAGGIPGPMDAGKTMIMNAPNLPGWVKYPLRDTLAEKLGTQVLLENDAALAGLGEAVFGAGQGKKIVAYLTISTGIGGTRIVNSQIDSSSLGFEPGHHTIHPDGFLCGCGSKGHLEAYASGTGLKKQFGQPAHEIKDPAIWKQVCGHLAVGLNNVLCFWSPDIIVLGGSLMKSLSIDILTEELKNLKPVFPNIPPLAKANLGNDSGLYGALAYATSFLPPSRS